MVQVKICGIKDQDTLDVCRAAGANMAGFVFYPPSPRHVEPVDIASLDCDGIQTVGLFVNPSEQSLQDIFDVVDLDMIQLHGDETPDNVRAIKNMFGRPIIKAFRVDTVDDLAQVHDFNDAVDWFIFDSKPAGADLPGGTGHSFSWNILAGQDFKTPWLLSGGLHAGNVSSAINMLKDEPNFMGVDVSSGVESARGIKCDKSIEQFIKTCRIV